MRTFAICVMLLCLSSGLYAADSESGKVIAGNLIYAGTKTSKCFSSSFLTEVKKMTSINTQSEFVKVKLADAGAMKNYPFVIMNGEGSFTLTQTERDNLKTYLSNGGFLLSSAGCSSSAWSSSMRRELVKVFGKKSLIPITTKHPLFHTLHDIDKVPLKDGGYATFEGVMLDNRLVALFSPEGLNNTAAVKGCCCCGGNEVKISAKVVSNALVYSLIE